MNGTKLENVQCVKDLDVSACRMFSIDNTPQQSNGVKLRCKHVQRDCTKFLFTNDV